MVLVAPTSKSSIPATMLSSFMFNEGLMSVLFQLRYLSLRRTVESTGCQACWASGRHVRTSSRPRCWSSTATWSTVTMILLHTVPSYAPGTIKEIPPEGTASWQSSLLEDTLPMSAFPVAESRQLTSRKATRKSELYLTVITVPISLATQWRIPLESRGQTMSGFKHFQKRTCLHQMCSLKITLHLNHNKPLNSRPLKTKRMKRSQMQKMIRIRRLLHQPKHRHLWVRRKSQKSRTRKTRRKLTKR